MEDSKKVQPVDARTVLNNLLFYTEGRIEEIEKLTESLRKVEVTLTDTEQAKIFGRELELQKLKQAVEASINGLDN